MHPCLVSTVTQYMWCAYAQFHAAMCQLTFCAFISNCNYGMLVAGQHVVFCHFSVVDGMVSTFMRGHCAVPSLCLLLQAMKHMILVAVCWFKLRTPYISTLAETSLREQGSWRSRY